MDRRPTLVAGRNLLDPSKIDRMLGWKAGLSLVDGLIEFGNTDDGGRK